jgi:hypothetical protein
VSQIKSFRFHLAFAPSNGILQESSFPFMMRPRLFLSDQFFPRVSLPCFTHRFTARALVYFLLADGLYQAKKGSTSRINIDRRAKRALDGSRIGLNYVSVPSPGVNVNSSDKVSVYTANEGRGIIAPVIIEGELLPSWVTANTLVRGVPQNLGCTWRSRGPRRIRFEKLRCGLACKDLRQSGCLSNRR